MLRWGVLWCAERSGRAGGGGGNPHHTLVRGYITQLYPDPRPPPLRLGLAMAHQDSAPLASAATSLPSFTAVWRVVAAALRLRSAESCACALSSPLQCVHQARQTADTQTRAPHDPPVSGAAPAHRTPHTAHRTRDDGAQPRRGLTGHAASSRARCAWRRSWVTGWRRTAAPPTGAWAQALLGGHSPDHRWRWRWGWGWGLGSSDHDRPAFSWGLGGVWQRSPRLSAARGVSHTTPGGQSAPSSRRRSSHRYPTACSAADR
eukprot:COSAG01_NODE_6314_length_3741_cov_18.754256_4_plen_261_part_00